MASGYVNDGTYNPNMYLGPDGTPTIDISLKPPVLNGSGPSGNDSTSSTGIGVGSNTMPSWLGSVAFFILGFLLLAVAMWAAINDSD